MTACKPFAELAFNAQHPRTRFATRLVDRVLIEAAAVAKHRLTYLVGQHRADGPEIVTDLFDFLSDQREKAEFGGKSSSIGLPPLRDEMAHLDKRRWLPMPIDAAVSLLHSRRVPWDLPVKEPPTVTLQVDAFRGRIGGKQDPHRRS